MVLHYVDPFFFLSSLIIELFVFSAGSLSKYFHGGGTPGGYTSNHHFCLDFTSMDIFYLNCHYSLQCSKHFMDCLMITYNLTILEGRFLRITVQTKTHKKTFHQNLAALYPVF